MVNTFYITFVLIAATISACGSSEPVTAKKDNSAGLTGDIPCTKGSCPPIQLFLNASPMQAGVLIGDTANQQPFMITGGPSGSSRDIRMMAFNPPKGGEFIGQGSLNIQASYKSIEAVQAQAPIEVVIRDVSRCRMAAPHAGNQCENLQATGLEAFEHRQQFNWQIIEAPIEQFMDPTFIAQQGPLLGANSGMTGCAQGFIQGGLGGLTGGSPIQAILGGAVGCLGNSFGNLGQ